MNSDEFFSTMDRVNATREFTRVRAILDLHEPEQGHREAYCSCEAPIGDWGAEFLDHLARAIVEGSPS